jgi:hypothetical protein
MKKILFFLVATVLFAVSCKKDFGDLNVDTKNPSAVPPGPLFSYAEKQLADLVTNSNVNVNVFRLFSQYWTETTYIDEANYDLTTRNIPQNFWNRMYVNVLKNLDESQSLIASQGAVPANVQKNQNACIEILTVYCYSTMVNVYGNVPYTQALDFNNLFPAYDDGKTIYTDLTRRLDAAINSIETGAEGFGSNDLISGGNMAAWKQFGNSLKLRMGMLLADSDAATAKTMVEAAAAGAIADNADNTYFHYLTAPPNTNQIWVDLVQSGRKDFVAANTIVDIMNGLTDPRMSYYFTTDAAGGYSGGPYAENNNYATYSKPSVRIIAPEFEATLFDAAETHFLLAEAVERGMNVGGTAAEHYEAGIRASMSYWEVPAADQDTYVASAAVAYATATGDWKQKIGTQKWLALYNRGLEGWTEWRRLDYPILNVPTGQTYGDIPVRFPFPVQEQNLNTANWQAASSAVGGDNVRTKLFWDKN